jgi:Protein of unknown function (DUF4238)
MAVAEMEKEAGEKIDVDEYRKKLTGGSVYAEQTNRAWSLKQMFESMLTLQKDIYKMFWTFLIAPDGDDGFLTSDNPVAFFHPAEGINGRIGPATLAAPHFTFPVCKEICLLTQPFRNPGQVALNASDVRQVNRGTITVPIVSCMPHLTQVRFKHCSSRLTNRLSDPIAFFCVMVAWLLNEISGKHNEHLMKLLPRDLLNVYFRPKRAIKAKWPML